MSRPSPKQLRDEITWLKAKLGTATGFTVPLAGRGCAALADSLIRQGDRFAIVRHRLGGAEAYIGDQWVPIDQLPEEAFAFDAVDAHRLADVLIAEEIAQASDWGVDFDTREPVTAENLDEFAEVAR